jgi:hypothetical protein
MVMARARDLRLVTKIASGYRGYGLPISDRPSGRSWAPLGTVAARALRPARAGVAISLMIVLGPGIVHTGVSILASELYVKRLEILHEFVPQARRIAALADPTTISTRAQLASGARDLGLELVQFEAQSPDEIGRALDAIAIAKVEAVNVLASPILNAARRLIIDRMFRRLPNCGEADQDSCDAALREIIPRLQSTFDVAPDD